MVHLSDLKCIGFCSFSPATLRSTGRRTGVGMQINRELNFSGGLKEMESGKCAGRSINGEGSEERKGPQIEIKEQGSEGD